ncbi:MAG: transcriptional regulator with XRE-family HTH domain [Saprospiraceae bacterium]
MKKYRKVLTQIVAARITSGLPEAQIADKTGISAPRYSEIERGNVQLGIADMFAIGEVLKMEVSVLF